MFCPNCEAQFSLAPSVCPQCSADFGPGSAWKLMDRKPEPSRSSAVLPLLAAPVWFGLVGPAIPAPVMYLLGNFGPLDTNLSVAARASAAVYPWALVFGGPVALIYGLVFAAALLLILKQKHRFGWLLSGKRRMYRALAVTALLTLVLSAPAWFSLFQPRPDIRSGGVALFIAPTFLCGLPFCYWFLRRNDA
jgi:hypothetical protein